MADRLESEFQKNLKDEITHRFPGCVIFKQDPNVTHQGIPDLLILHGSRWAMLEVKRTKKQGRRFENNQEWYVDKYNAMSFAASVDKDNYVEVLDALQSSFGAQG